MPAMVAVKIANMCHAAGVSPSGVGITQRRTSTATGTDQRMSFDLFMMRKTPADKQFQPQTMGLSHPKRCLKALPLR